MKSALKKTTSLLRKAYIKYVVATTLFVGWVGFFDKQSVVEHLAMKRNIANLQQEIQEQHIIIEQNTARLHELKTSNAALERFARVRYLMHLPNEDIFIVK
jgi:cell division protein FtsB